MPLTEEKEEWEAGSQVEEMGKEKEAGLGTLTHARDSHTQDAEAGPLQT